MTTNGAFERKSNSIDDRLVRRFWDMDRFVDPATEEQASPRPLPLAQVLANVDRLAAEILAAEGWQLRFDVYRHWLVPSREAR